MLALSENLTDQVREGESCKVLVFIWLSEQCADPGPTEGGQCETEAGEWGTDQSHDGETQVIAHCHSYQDTAGTSF